MNQPQLLRHIGELVDLLETCGQQERAQWLADQRRELAAGTEGVRATIQEQLAGGMGSLLDLPLNPAPESGMSSTQARDRLWTLIELIDHELTATS